MADEANAPVPVDATKATEEPTRPADTPTEPAAAEAKLSEGGDVATEAKNAEGPKPASTSEGSADHPAADDTTNTSNTQVEGEPAAESTAEVAATNGTPASKKGNFTRRKSGTNVSENKKKTPAKKKGPANLHLNVEPGELWFVAMRGFPPWPVIICDEQMLPEALLSKRPVSAKRIDGTYREDFLEGAKNAKDRRYPVMFLGTNEFAWQVNTELQPLDLEAVKKDVESGNNQKKTKNLWEAYQIAAEGHDLAWFKDLLESHESAMQVDPDEEETAPVTKKEVKKAKRKSQAVDESEDVDMEDAEDTGAASAKKAKQTKKRKKDAESDGEPDKPAKTPKTTKLKLNAPKDTSAAKPKKETKPKKTKAKAEVEEVEPAKPQDPPLTEAERREKQEKSVLYLRHRLQKGFLSRDQAPKEEEMSNMSEYLKQLELTENLDAEVIKKTKVHKVLKAIVKLDSIPKEEEFNFKTRSTDLLTQWTKVLSADGETGEAAAAAPTTNGASHELKGSEAKSPANKSEDTVAKPEANTAEDTGDVVMAEATNEALVTKADAGLGAEATTGSAA